MKVPLQGVSNKTIDFKSCNVKLTHHCPNLSFGCETDVFFGWRKVEPRFDRTEQPGADIFASFFHDLDWNEKHTYYLKRQQVLELGVPR